MSAMQQTVVYEHMPDDVRSFELDHYGDIPPLMDLYGQIVG